jgi:hypothetical protein
MGEVEVGSVGVTEQGEITGGFGADKLMQALWRIKPLSAAPGAPAGMPADAELRFEDGFEGFDLRGVGADGDDDAAPRDSFFADLDNTGH